MSANGKMRIPPSLLQAMLDAPSIVADIQQSTESGVTPSNDFRVGLNNGFKFLRSIVDEEFSEPLRDNTATRVSYVGVKVGDLVFV
jgi:hypothetical protein